MAKLKETQKIEILTKYANGASILALSGEYGVSRPTIQRYIDENPELLSEIKQAQTKGVREWLQKRTGKIIATLDEIFSLLPSRLKDASLRDLMGAFKIIVDIMANVAPDNETEKTDNTITFVFADTSGRTTTNPAELFSTPDN